MGNLAVYNFGFTRWLNLACFDYGLVVVSFLEGLFAFWTEEKHYFRTITSHFFSIGDERRVFKKVWGRFLNCGENCKKMLEFLNFVHFSEYFG